VSFLFAEPHPSAGQNDMWKQLDSGRVEHRFESVVLIATLLLIPILIVENEARSDAWRGAAKVANWVVWAVFAAELAFILLVAPRRKAALRAHWLDAVIVLTTTPFFGAFLSSLRLVRLARLLRLGAILTRLLQRERTLFSGKTAPRLLFPRVPQPMKCLQRGYFRRDAAIRPAYFSCNRAGDG
jgi:hypothetical protein